MICSPIHSILVLACEICGLLIELSAGFVFGDPHVTTVSGRRYTFNGLGEYWLLQTQAGVNASLSVQCRTELASAQGSDSATRATVFTAFAFRGIATMPVIQVWCLSRIASNKLVESRSICSLYYFA